MRLDVRPAAVQDIPAIEEIGRKTWPPTYSFAGDEYVANGLATWWSPKALLRSMNTTTVLVAVRGDQVIGVGNIDLRGDVPVIWKLYVLPSAQASGVGSALLAALLTCVPAGTGAVRLEYLQGNQRAAAFYAAKGFTELRREPGEQPGWPDTVWVERRCQTPGERPS